MYLIANGSWYWITRRKYLAWLYLNSHILKPWMANQKSDAFVLPQWVNITFPILPVEYSCKIPAVKAKTVLFLSLCYSHVTRCFQTVAEDKLLLFLVKNTRTGAYKDYYLHSQAVMFRERDGTVWYLSPCSFCQSILQLKPAMKNHH